MAVAVPASPSDSSTTTAPLSLWTASLIGAVFVLVGLGIVFYAVPQLWNSVAGSFGNSFIQVALRLVIQVAALGALIWFGRSMIGSTSLKGLSGGIFWALVTLIFVFFGSRWLAMRFFLNTEMSPNTGLIFWVVFLALFGFFGLRFLRGRRFIAYAQNMESAGWFTGKQYKKNQGVRVRRLTILGLLLLLGSGIYTLATHQLSSASTNWVLSTPFFPESLQSLTLLPDQRFTIPLLLALLAIWFSYRVVNTPSFADFLIATEAELNKVSWTPRAQLIRDTIVVLICVVIITLFLFIVDIMWGWLLSRGVVGVLPSDEDKAKIREATTPADRELKY